MDILELYSYWLKWLCEWKNLDHSPPMTVWRLSHQSTSLSICFQREQVARIMWRNSSLFERLKFFLPRFGLLLGSSYRFATFQQQIFQLPLHLFLYFSPALLHTLWIIRIIQYYYVFIWCWYFLLEVFDPGRVRGRDAISILEQTAVTCCKSDSPHHRTTNCIPGCNNNTRLSLILWMDIPRSFFLNFIIL